MNSLDTWRKIILTLPDPAFFRIVRNYLGTVRTPFHKPSLIQDLIVFLRKRDTIEQIFRRIDEVDAQILTAIQVIPSPVPEKLAFVLNLPFLKIHHYLLNLEERLLIFTDPQSGILFINPLYEEELKDRVFALELLFPSKAFLGEPPGDSPWLTSSLLIAVLSLLFACPEVSSGGTKFKKKAASLWKKRIPLLFKDEKSGKNNDLKVITRFERLLRTLEILGLVIWEDTFCRPVLSRWAKLSECPDREIPLRLWGAWAVSSKNEPLSGNGKDTSLKTAHLFASLLRPFLEIIPEGRIFSRQSLITLLKALSPSQNPLDSESCSNLLNALTELSVLLPVQNSVFILSPWFSGLKEAGAEREGVLQPNFEVALMPWTPLKKGVFIALVADLFKFDLYPHFELNRSSCFRTFDEGYDTEGILKALEELTGNPPPQNIRFSIGHWEGEYNSVQLNAGIVLSVSDDRRPYLEHSKEFQPWIKQHLAKGVYLLDPADIHHWSKALADAGIDPLPKVHGLVYTAAASIGENTSNRTDIPGDLSFTPLSPKKLNISGLKTNYILPPPSDIEDLFNTLRALSLPGDQRKELEARIQRKIILFPEQITAGQVVHEKIEARGLDYSGKVRLIDEALASGHDLLELEFRGADGDKTSFLIKPTTLEKEGTNRILHGIRFPEGNDGTYKVRKLTAVRKLRISLYYP